MSSVDIIWNFKFPKTPGELVEQTPDGNIPRYFVKQVRKFDADGTSNDLSILMRMLII